MTASDSASAYEAYCATSIFDGRVDPEAALEWKRGYFAYHYLRHLPADKEAAIADVGCGFGAYLRTLMDLGYTNVHGVDLGAAQIEWARDQLGLGDRVEQDDASAWLEQRPDTFDCILVFDVLEHLELQALLRLGRAIHGALKRGGRVIVQAPNDLSPLNPVRQADITHVRCFTVQSLRQFFAYSQLEPIHFLELGQFPHGLRSRIQLALWRLIFAPLFRAFVLLVHGRVEGGIHSINVGAVARRTN
jgi:2-polyprenyl-3-methyl-5-hydroxy-6-metoxy-1,4-benzoquinol methylase